MSSGGRPTPHLRLVGGRGSRWARVQRLPTHCSGSDDAGLGSSVPQGATPQVLTHAITSSPPCSLILLWNARKTERWAPLSSGIA